MGTQQRTTMKVTVKSVDKSIRVVEGDFVSVKHVSQALAEEHGFEEERQQLIFNGKVLKPDDTVPEMSETAFMVLMMKKAPKPKKPAQAPAQTVEAKPTSTETTQNASEESQPAGTAGEAQQYFEQLMKFEDVEERKRAFEELS